MCMFDGIFDSIQEKENKIIENVLLKHGYTISWVLNNKNRIFVELELTPSEEIYKFKINGDVIFILHRIHELTDNTYKITWVID